MRLAVTAVVLSLTAQAGADEKFLLVGNSTADKVMQFSATDGSLINANFIPASHPSFSFQTPRAIKQVGDEIWISDQLRDRVYRFDLEGNYLSQIGPHMLDNLRGLEHVNGIVYLCNAGSANQAYERAIYKLDATTGEFLGFFYVQTGGDPFDVIDYNGELLVCHDLNDRFDRYSYSGTFLGVFHDSNGLAGIDFPQQMSITAAGTLLVAGWDPPIGIYEYNSAGEQINRWLVGNGNRGVYELPDGRIFFTDENGVHILDRSSGAVQDVMTGFTGQYVGVITIPTGGPSCVANCDGSTDDEGNPTLTTADFTCFRTAYLAGDLSLADCDQNGTLSTADFTCFRTAYLNGCP